MSASTDTTSRFRVLLQDHRVDCVQQREAALAECAQSVPDPVAQRQRLADRSSVQAHQNLFAVGGDFVHDVAREIDVAQVRPTQLGSEQDTPGQCGFEAAHGPQDGVTLGHGDRRSQTRGH